MNRNFFTIFFIFISLFAGCSNTTNTNSTDELTKQVEHLESQKELHSYIKMKSTYTITNYSDGTLFFDITINTNNSFSKLSHNEKYETLKNW